MPGLGIRTNQRSAVWFLKYRSNGKQVLTTIGPTDQLSEDEARAVAKRLKWDAKQGKGPVPKPKIQPMPTPTVSEFCLEYIERHAKPTKESWYKDAQRINTYIIPAWGKWRLDQISPQAVADLHSAIGIKGVAAVRKGVPEEPAPIAANRLLEQISTMLNLAVIWGKLPKSTVNPTKDIVRFPESKKTLWFTDEQLQAIIDEVNKLPQPHYRAYFHMLNYTGCRRTELLELEWKDVNMTRGVGSIYRGVTKNGEPLFLPIPDEAISVLETIPNRTGYVFPGRFEGTHWKRPDKVWWRIRDKVGISEDFGLHVFRHTFASRVLRMVKNPKIVQELLNHKSAATTARYLHLANDHLRGAMTSYAKDCLPPTETEKSEPDEATPLQT